MAAYNNLYLMYLPRYITIDGRGKFIKYGDGKYIKEDTSELYSVDDVKMFVNFALSWGDKIIIEG